jgi:uncharacterized protein (TIGR02001 family)
LIVSKRFRLAPAWACALALVAPQAARCQSAPVSFGGTVAATSDYIYHGVSQSDGQGALQADLHLNTDGGTFLGVWGSSRDRNLEPGTQGEVQIYAGQRFALGGDWSAAVSGRADYFVGGVADHSNDYQELSASLSWLDRYTFSLSAIPSAARYTTVSYFDPNYPGVLQSYYLVTRSAAFSADGSAQWLLRRGVLGGDLYATAAAGYYYSSRGDRLAVPPSAISMATRGFRSGGGAGASTSVISLRKAGPPSSFPTPSPGAWRER